MSPRNREKLKIIHGKERLCLANAQTRPNGGALRRVILTPKQRIFCIEYLKGTPANEAAKRAGYKRGHGGALLQIKVVKEYLKTMQDKLSQKEVVSWHWKLSKLKRCADVSMPEKGVDELSEREYELVNARYAIDSINEMNKMQGDHAPVKTDNHETTHLDINEIKEILAKKQKDY